MNAVLVAVSMGFIVGYQLKLVFKTIRAIGEPRQPITSTLASKLICVYLLHIVAVAVLYINVS